MNEFKGEIIQDALKIQKQEIQRGPGIDYNNLNMIKRAETLINSPEKTNQHVAEVAFAVAEHANKYDHIVVNGGSRGVSRVLLQACGIPAEKIITFDHQTNSAAYKDYDQYANLTLDQRVSGVIEFLESSGVDFASNPSICIVDDRIKSGGKAEKYLELFSRMPGLADFSFTTFSAMKFSDSAPRSQSYEPDPTPEGRIRTQFGKLASHFFFPREEFDSDPQALEEYFADLADLQSDLNPDHSNRIGWLYSQKVADVARKALTYTLNRLDKLMRGMRDENRTIVVNKLFAKQDALTVG